MIEVSLSTLIRSTESPDKVAKAIENLFPDLQLEVGEDRVIGRGGPESLRDFHRLLREQRILDTARSVMLRGNVDDAIQLRLNKQAATVGRINFPPQEEPLGSIHVQIKGPESLVDWLAPQTVEGRPVEEIKLDDVL